MDFARSGPLATAGVEADGEPNGTAALNNSRIGVNATEAERTSKRRKTLSTDSAVDAQGTAPTVDPPGTYCTLNHGFPRL